MELPVVSADVSVGDIDALVEEENPRIPVLPKEEIKMPKDIKQTYTVKAEPKHAKTHIPPTTKANPNYYANFPRRQMHAPRFS